MSSITVEEIISKYESTKKFGRPITPLSLFLLLNGDSIYKVLKEELGRRPTLYETRTAFSEHWKNISVTELNIYNEAATRLGYTPKVFNFNREHNVLKARINARIKELQNNIPKK